MVGWSMDLLLIFQLKVNVAIIGFHSIVALCRAIKRAFWKVRTCIKKVPKQEGETLVTTRVGTTISQTKRAKIGERE